MNNHIFTNQNDQSHQSLSKAKSWLHLLQDPDARQVAIDAVCALFSRWHLHPINQAALLGLSDMSELQEFVSVDEEPLVFIRIGHLLAIDRALLKRYPYQPTKRDQWVLRSQLKLHGQTPMALMLREELDGIKLVHSLLETEATQPRTVFI